MAREFNSDVVIDGDLDVQGEITNNELASLLRALIVQMQEQTDLLQQLVR